jgi:PadR family transcriptional regulator, regulatory protein PadR
VRKTHATVQVAMTLLDEPLGRHWGYDLSKKSGVRSGTLYPMLTQMLDQGWLADGWEDPRSIEGRPPRRYYEITDLGRVRLSALLADARTDRRFAALPWARRPVPGS